MTHSEQALEHIGQGEAGDTKHGQQAAHCHQPRALQTKTVSQVVVKGMKQHDSGMSVQSDPGEPNMHLEPCSTGKHI
jgi:hypothetical protein